MPPGSGIPAKSLDRQVNIPRTMMDDLSPTDLGLFCLSRFHPTVSSFRLTKIQSMPSRFPLSRWINTALGAVLLPIASAQSVPFGGHKDSLHIESDAFQGDWTGTWASGRAVVAMVIARGDGDYSVRVQDDFDHRTPPYDIVNATVINGELHLVDDVWSGVFDHAGFTGIGRFRNDQVSPLSLKPSVRHSPTEGLPAPPAAQVHFDGSNFEQWKSSHKTDDRITWNLRSDGAMEIGIDATGKGHGLETRQKFGDLELHLEFRLPLQPRSTGQPRGNSGLFIGGYEIQILDSYGLEGYYNECGAFYKFKAPAVNMCYPPLQWQTYDVKYTAARFDSAGEIESWPRFTVRHNGRTIHDDITMDSAPVIRDGEWIRPSPDRRPISLQFHGSRLQFRNIWVISSR